MTRAQLMERLRSPKILIPLVVVVILAVVGVVVTSGGSGSGYRTTERMVTGTPEPDGTAVTLDTTLYVPDGARVSSKSPAVLLAQGFGGSKDGLADTAKALAAKGYVALAYTARGFGASGGFIHFDSPDYEVKDAALLVTELTKLPEVDAAKIAVAGASYGGGLALLLAGTDKRIKAVAADITWNDLSRALFPNYGGTGPGVFKSLWAGALFGNAFAATQATASVAAAIGVGGNADTASGTDTPTVPTGSVGCGRFAADVCAAYEKAAQTGTPDATMTALMQAASPQRVLSRITAPTLLTQGEQDSLFPLSEADANARGIAATGTPVRVVWRRGGHDDSSRGDDVATSQMLDWFATALGGGTIPRKQVFQFAEQGALLSSSSGRLRTQIRQADAYPGIDGTSRASTQLALQGPAQTIAAPAGGAPAAITAIPGLSGILSSLGGLTSATAALSAIPSQTAAFASPAMSSSMLIAGSSTVTLSVTSKTATDATLFVALRDVGSDGNTLPSQLVSPVRLIGLTPGRATRVTVTLPPVVRTVAAKHRLVLTVSTTDFAYRLPADAREYTVSVGALATTTLTVSTIRASVLRDGHPLAWVIVGVLAVLLAILGVGFVIRRRRSVLKPRPDLARVPVSIESLVKEYAGGYRAVDGVSFTVERGQVVGLLGPNGAGKTTALRVLVGLITPTAGQVHLFGEPVVPGAPVLARLGAFIEGPGFLPHLSGRENLRLFWAATGRPDAESHLETALEIAGLGGSIDRRVKSYSQGMRQRLGIAQAMLGLPELLVLDEPTNGLDPPQIAEMREVMKSYASTGRTVVVSSHLLAEVEQTCSHVVVLHKGKLVAAGSVVDIAGAGGTQLSVDDPSRAAAVLAGAGMTATLVPARRALEDVFLGLIGDDE